MKSLTEQIKDVMQSKASKTIKTQDLIKLGIKKQDIANLFKFYQLDSDETIPYTIGVEIECYNVDKNAFLAYALQKGVQVEYEGYNHDTRNHYKVVDNSSITGANALECVSPVLKGKTGLKSLKNVCEALNTAGAKVNKSTGLHVHVGLQSIDEAHYTNIFVNYHYLEPVIDKFMANSRRGDNNNYCHSLQSISVEAVNACENEEQIARMFNFSRYFKVNPASYSRHKTLEFRQHQGTTEFEKIEKWVMFVTFLAEWSKKKVLTDYVTEIDKIPFLLKAEKTYFKKRAIELK